LEVQTTVVQRTESEVAMKQQTRDGMNGGPLPGQPDVLFFDRMARFAEKNYWQRLRLMIKGLAQPHDSGAYRQARTELQRQIAPLTALLLPLVCILALSILVRARPAEEQVLVLPVEPAPTTLPPLKPIDPQQPLPPAFEPLPAFFPGSGPRRPAALPSAPEPPRQAAPTTPTESPVLFRLPVVLQGFLGRQPGERDKILQGSYSESAAQTEGAVIRALRWLKLQQQEDGSWPRNNPAMTALSVLAFLAHNETPESPEFGDSVRRGIEFLLASQPPTGQWRGNYEHYIVTYALCEAYGMTLNPTVKTAAGQAVRHIIEGQHPTGGWDYGLKPGERDDTSVMGWAAQALKAAVMADFYSEPEALRRACKLAVRGFQKNAHPGGGFGYTGPGRGGLSSVGVLGMQFHGGGATDEVRRTLDLLGTWRPVWVGNQPGKRTNDVARPVTVPGLPPGGNPQYYFYYGTQALFQEGGEAWKRWNAVMWPAYVNAQFIKKQAIADAKGILQDIGWWENTDQHSDRPVMDTCLAALQLMVYYRYLPTFKVPEQVARATPTATGPGDVPVSSDL
jgi:hypothetical protein